jgi:indolepyruvate ferredoxin oxidoreductase beta subunit
MSTDKKMHMGANNTIVNILFCGTGGQGVLTAAEVCAWAAIFSGFQVKKSEVHGMAQRGGSVESHLRFGQEVFSPLIPQGKVDFLVPFYQDEGLRLKNLLKIKGVSLLSALETAQTAVRDKKYLNIFLLGVLSRYLTIKEENWIKAIEKVFLNKNLEENKKIFKNGRGEQR